jgi:large subunit ribosomal protein L24
MATRAAIMKNLMKPGNTRLRELKPQFLEAAKKTSWNILRGDRVQVIERKHREYGKQGIVLEVDRKRDRVTIEGVNLASYHIKGDAERGTKSKTIQKERSLHYSNVNLVDPVTGFPTRVSRTFLEDGTKVRVAKKSGAIIPRPEILSIRKRPARTNVTESDTVKDEDVWEVTYVHVPKEVSNK